MGHIWSRIFKQRAVRIILVGLDAAGKTTLLYKLKLGDISHLGGHVIPTIGFNVESFDHRDLQITAWDIGSRDKMRALFRHYYKGADAVVVVIDSSDRQRLDELNYDVIKPAVQSDDLSHATLLFLANKQDLPGVMDVGEISERLNLSSISQTWEIFPISALQGSGIYEALDWLACQMGSSQAKKAVASPAKNSSDFEEGTNSNMADKAAPQKDYCSRAYTAIKCLFKSSKPDQSENSG